MKILALSALFITAACSWTGNNNPEYVWIGCHEVVNNDTRQANNPFGPFGVPIEVVGNRIFYKQVNLDGSVSEVISAVPCK